MKYSILALFTALLLQGCVKTDTFVDIERNPQATTLQKDDIISDQGKDDITGFIKQKTHFDACVALKGNNLVYEYGATHIPYNSASVRKSIFSAVYGIAEEKGLIDLDATLGELGIDDSENPLTETEKTATIRNLLQARSGIYLPAAGESDGMRARKPERGEYLPGEHFYYNNWDFNVLPIILERLTNKTIGELIYEWIAVPTGMRNFAPENVTYQYVDYTEYPQTRVYITAEDLARIGALYLNQGKWNNTKVIPEIWTKVSVEAVSEQPEDADLLTNELMEGYAYLWWVDEDENTFWADGSGGQFLVVDTTRNLSVVLRNNTGMSAASYILYESTERFEGNIKGNEVSLLSGKVYS